MGDITHTLTLMGTRGLPLVVAMQKGTRMSVRDWHSCGTPGLGTVVTASALLVSC